MRKFFALLFCINSAIVVRAQSIDAGQYSVDDYHYQFIPDTVIQRHGLGYYSIDINGDNIDDFLFTLYPGSGSLGQQYTSSSIKGLDNNKVAVSHVDSCFN